MARQACGGVRWNRLHIDTAPAEIGQEARIAVGHAVVRTDLDKNAVVLGAEALRENRAQTLDLAARIRAVIGFVVNDYFRLGARFLMNASIPSRPSSPAKLAAMTLEASA